MSTQTVSAISPVSSFDRFGFTEYDLYRTQDEDHEQIVLCTPCTDKLVEKGADLFPRQRKMQSNCKECGKSPAKN